VVTHISLEWLGGGRWRLSVTRGQVVQRRSGPALAGEPRALRRVSTVEGTLENVRRVALRALRTLELESTRELRSLTEHLDPTVAYPISLDAVTIPAGVKAVDLPTPVVQNPFEAETAHDFTRSESSPELSAMTLVIAPSFMATTGDLAAPERD
jgi:hypothetical protein